MRRIEHLQAEAAARREELTATIDALEDKLNLPKQARLAVARARQSFRANPVPWVAGVAAVATAVVGAIVLGRRDRD